MSTPTKRRSRGMSTKDVHATELFDNAVCLLGKLPQGYSVYVASDTMCLMRGPSHDEHGAPQQANVIAFTSSVRISGGDW